MRKVTVTRRVAARPVDDPPRGRYRRAVGPRILGLGAGLLALALAAWPAKAESARSSDLVVLLDASRELADTVDGETELQIALDAVRDLAARLPAERRFGLVTYGADGGCAGVQTAVPTATVDGDALRAALRGLAPAGGGAAPV
ncbi:MAG: VWA domain-containing protein, partial [Acidobacteriota bacterium]